MRVYLMQHGTAMTKEQNPDRPLTEAGQQDVENVASFLAQTGIQVEQIQHSGKMRAKETAQIIGDHFRVQAVAITGLGPTDDVRPLAESLQTERHTVMLVGHLPFMSHLAGYLLTGSPGQNIVQFQQGGVLCLEKEEDFWVVHWMIVPELFPAK